MYTREMTNVISQNSFYITGGTLPADATSYVERAADRDLLSSLLASEYCYVLNSRQMGKSSLSVQTMGALNKAGVKTVFLDLTRFGGASVTPEQWYPGMLAEVGRSLSIRRELLDYWKEQQDQALVPRFFGAIREVVLERSSNPIVLFIDEIDAVKSLSFSTDEFFAALRECYNRRAQDETMRRLSICLVGSATPSDLIADTRTSPFNIGKRIELRDFTLDECLPLAAGVNRRNAMELVKRAFYWTNGHPCLTQSICAAIAQDSKVVSAAGVDALVASLFFEAKARERNPNLTDVSNRILSSYLDPENQDEHRSSILDLYGKVLRGRERITDDETNRLVALLKLAGIVRSEVGSIVLRNRIYERVFDLRWIAQNMPDAELRRQQRAFRRGVLRTAVVSLAVLAVMGALAVSSYRNALQARRSAATEKRSAKRATENGDLAKAGAYRANLLLYAANINLAQQAYETGHLARVESLLKDTENSPDRGFEWNYLDRAVHNAQWEKRSSDGYVVPQFTNDGQRVAVIGATSRYGRPTAATLLDARTGRVLFHAGGTLRTGTFSADGRYLAASEAYTEFDRAPRYHAGKFTLWDTALGRKLYDLPGKHDFAEFSTDDRSLLTYDIQPGRQPGSPGQSELRLYDRQTGRLSVTLLGRWFSAGFSGDGTRILASGPTDVAIFDARTGKRQFSLRGAYETYGPAGDLFVTRPAKAIDISVLTVWDVATGRRVGLLRTALPEYARANVLPRSRRVLTTIWLPNMKYQMWDLRTGNELYSFGPRSHSIYGGMVNVSADETRIGVSGMDGGTSVRNAATGKEIRSIRGVALNAALSPNGRSVLTTDMAGTVRYYELSAEAERKKIAAAVERIYGFTPDGGAILVHARRGKGYVDRLLNVETGATQAEFESTDAFMDQSLTMGTFSYDGARMVQSNSNSHPDRAIVFDTHTGRALLTLTGHKGRVMRGAFSRDGRLIATGGVDRTARVWDAATGRQIFALAGFRYQVGHLGFSSDGSLLVGISWKPDKSGLLPHHVMTFDVSTGRLLHEFEGTFRQVEAPPAGRAVVFVSEAANPAGGKYSVVTVRDAVDGHLLFTRPNSSIDTVLRDAARLVVVSEMIGVPSNLDVLDIRTGKTVASGPGSLVFLSHVVSSDCRRVVVTNALGRMTIWSLVSGRQLMSLPSSGGMTNMLISRDGSRIATYEWPPGGTPSSLTIWNVSPRQADAVGDSGPGPVAR